jgi:hypothetical protein
VRGTGLPANPRISGYEWSRDGRHLALALLRPRLCGGFFILDRRRPGRELPLIVAQSLVRT